MLLQLLLKCVLLYKLYTFCRDRCWNRNYAEGRLRYREWIKANTRHIFMENTYKYFLI